MSFSNSHGGSFALPSPTHGPRLDVDSAVRTLRRSMSRSPSGLNLRTHYASPDGFKVASPSTPCRRYRPTPQHQQQQLLVPEHPHSAPPAPDLRSSRLSLRALKATRTASPSRPLARARASPKSPFRRPLNHTADAGNSAQQPPLFLTNSLSSTGQENNKSSTNSPARPNLAKPSRHSLHLDVSGASQNAIFEALNTKAGSPIISNTGALKRSDATMNLDQPNQGSPVAKRRSMHGIASFAAEFGGDFDFGFQNMSPQGFDIHEDAATDSESLVGEGWGTQTPSHLPKRSSSLRKSTLQQRHGEKGGLSFGRRNGERQLAEMRNTDLATPVKNRPRLSTDQFCPPPAAPRESLFSSVVPLPSASMHMMENKGMHQPHPLSKTLSTSSSGNSLTEETDQYAPVPQERCRPHQVPFFARSLPLNATRPTARPPHDHTRAVAATPNQQGQLWPGAFNTTGLISKVNRNLDDDDKKLAPPDTPCKKHNHNFATFPPPLGSALKKKKKSNNRNSFGGIPSTPFTPAASNEPDTFGNQGKGLHIFQRTSTARSARRGGLLFQSETYDMPKLLDDMNNDMAQLEDVPPTPTKNSVTPSLSNLSEQSLDQSLESPSANRTAMLPMSAVRPATNRQQSCKSHSNLPRIPEGTAKSNTYALEWPSVQDVQRSIAPHMSLASFGRSRAQRGFRPPAPLGTSVPASPSLNLSQESFTKAYLQHSASPVSGRRTPQTPQEHVLPLDTSRLSISQGTGEAPLSENSMPPPVTPTTVRDFKSSTSVFITPVNGRTNLDIDSSLYTRFDKVEQIGKGEFSTVYRVVQNEHRYNTFDVLASSTPQTTTPQSSAKAEVYAVKKSRYPFQGLKDREIKQREAHILKALCHAEHVVRYVSDWEHQFHLYIQTEFCEEGTLEKFLGNVGFGGRLDDFRIFKILQDLCLVSEEWYLNDLNPPLTRPIGPQRNSYRRVYASRYETSQYFGQL